MKRGYELPMRSENTDYLLNILYISHYAHICDNLQSKSLGNKREVLIFNSVKHLDSVKVAV